MGDETTAPVSTGPKMAEAWAPADRAYLEALVNMLPSMLWAATLNEGMDYASKRWIEFTGLPPEQLHREGIFSLIHPDDLPAMGAATSELRAGDEQVLRFRIRRFDGEWRWVEARLRAIAGDDGKLHIVGATTDINDQVEAEREIERRTHLLNQTLEVAKLGGFVWYFEPDGVGVQADAWGLLLEIMDVGPERMQGLTGIEVLLDIVHPDDHELVRTEMARALDPEIGIYAPEHRIIVRGDDGQPAERWISVFARMQFDELRRPRELLGVMQDVTARRREEQARLQLQKLEATASLAGGVAHDFGNIVGAILNAARVGQLEARAGHDTTEILEEIAQAATRAADLVERLVNFAKPREPERSELDLADLIDEVIGLSQAALPRHITIEAEHSEQLPEVCGDAGQLHQVLLNLLNNAAQAIGEQPGTISVLLDEARTTEGPAARIRVVDTGPGMGPDVLRRVFDPFFTTRGSSGGTGLGLAAVQTIIAAHRGTVDVTSTLGRGTTFTVLLPIAADGRVGVLLD